jgi:hypothetical protein
LLTQDYQAQEITRSGYSPLVKEESRSVLLGIETDPRLRVRRRSLRGLCKGDLSSLDSYDRVVNVEDEIYGELFELVERRLPSGV